MKDEEGRLGFRVAAHCSKSEELLGRRVWRRGVGWVVRVGGSIGLYNCTKGLVYGLRTVLG